MPRLKPAPGFITAKDTCSLLDISDATLSDYVKKGLLRRYGPEGRVYKFYKRSEVDALLLERATFSEYPEPTATTFEVASYQDLPRIVDILERTFHVKLNTNTFLRWFIKNPEIFFVLKDTSGAVVGIASIVPFREDVLWKFVRDEISIDAIGEDDVERFVPGKPLHAYILAVCVEPAFRRKLKVVYGQALLLRLCAFLEELGKRGVEIKTITARTFTPDGLRLLRKIGFPQLRSPVERMRLFSVEVEKSGWDVLIRYTAFLDQYKHEHERV